MVSQCANPKCEAQFLYLGKGQLFALRREKHLHELSRLEFFWLCSDCAPEFKLEVTSNGALNVVPRAPGPVQASRMSLDYSSIRTGSADHETEHPDPQNGQTRL
jgi:hypothetical protein